jgi:hypothetical protein
LRLLLFSAHHTLHAPALRPNTVNQTSSREENPPLPLFVAPPVPAYNHVMRWSSVVLAIAFLLQSIAAPCATRCLLSHNNASHACCPQQQTGARVTPCCPASMTGELQSEEPAPPFASVSAPALSSAIASPHSDPHAQSAAAPFAATRFQPASPPLILRI